MLSWWCCTLCSCADAGLVVCVCCCGTLPESPSRSLAGTRPLATAQRLCPYRTQKRGNWNGTAHTTRADAKTRASLTAATTRRDTLAGRSGPGTYLNPHAHLAQSRNCMSTDIQFGSSTATSVSSVTSVTYLHLHAHRTAVGKGNCDNARTGRNTCPGVHS